MSAPDPLHDFLAAQRREYGQKLPGRVAAIRTAWERAAASRGDDDYRVLEREAHSIAGSGGTFGFAAAGDMARTLEHAIERRDHGAIEAALAALEEAARHGG
jgi:HPt (histidine-containing phosphotransfer) domain-containing protein